MWMSISEEYYEPSHPYRSVRLWKGGRTFERKEGKEGSVEIKFTKARRSAGDHIFSN